MAPRALERAVAGAHSLTLAQTLRPGELRRLIEDLRSRTPGPGKIGTLRDLWIEPDPGIARTFRRRYARHFAEEAGSWWVLKGRPAFELPVP